MTCLIFNFPHVPIISSIIVCVLQVTSSLTGSIIVEDVVYENVDSEVSCIFPSRELVFRRLVFERAANLVQSEALLKDEQLPTKLVSETGRKKTNSSSRSRKSGSQRRSDGNYFPLASHVFRVIADATPLIDALIFLSNPVSLFKLMYCV